MRNINELIDNTGILLTNVVMAEGISKSAFYKFVKVNGFEQVGHGVYVSPDTWEDESYILSLRCPNAVFSHDEALYFHGLVDREPFRRTITVYTGYGTGKLIKDGVRVYTVKQELLDLGKEYVVNAFGHKIPVYNLERTICDLVRSRNRFEIQDFQTALRSYAARKDKNLDRLMEYAKYFHIERKIREYMEVLLL